MKNLIALVVTVFSVVFVSSMAYSADMSIDMLNKLGKEKMVYSVDVAEIDVGDTITWLPASKGHNVHLRAQLNTVYQIPCLCPKKKRLSSD